MKKTLVVFLSLFIATGGAVAFSAQRFEGKGEVTNSDPLYGQVTIKHGPIKGLMGAAETDFSVASHGLLKNIGKRDLVDFVAAGEKNNLQIEKITKTGEAPPKEDEGLPVGKAVQGVLEATGEAAKTVTTPIQPAHEVVSGTMGATTDTTGAVLNDANPDVKKKF